MKTLIGGLTTATVFVAAEIQVRRSEPSDEARAIGALRTVAAGQQMYAATTGGYATSLGALAAACSRGQSAFVSPDLSGDPSAIGAYEIRLHASTEGPTGNVDCHGNPTARGYYATAVSLRRDAKPTRAFAVDQNGVMWFDVTGVAPKPPFHETATVRRLQ